MSSLRVSVECPDEDLTKDHWITHLFDAVTIRSISKGRIRFHLGFGGDEVLADSIRRELQKIETVKLENYSERTRNALVTFNPERVSEIGVSTALLKGVREFARLHGECDLEHHHHDRSNHGEECDHDHSAITTDAGIRKELLKLLGTGGVLGYFVYRRLKGKPFSYSGNPLADVASLLTIAAGYPIFKAGLDSVQKNKKATDDTLISIAVLATLLMGESITGLSVVWLINLGRLLEAVTLKRSRTAIKELMDVSPKEAWLVKSPHSNGRPSKIERIDVEKIEKHQVIRIYHSEKVPLDGRIIQGQALIKESFITGESIPREKTVGETVYAGSVVEQGDIDIEVTNLVHDTVVARMIDAIENVRDKKAPIEKIGDRFASRFVPVSIGISVVTLVLTGDLRRAITMLVIACPCAAGLATPTAVSASIGQAARKGILIKGGTHIEAAAKIDTIIFDKTGTLTVGTPTLNHFLSAHAVAGLTFEKCLKLAASAEQHTTHPLGLVLVKEAKAKNLELFRLEKHKIHPGMGVVAEINGQTIHIGNRRFMAKSTIQVASAFDSEAQQGFIAGESILYFAVDGTLHGAFIVQDQVRPEAAELIASLRELGIKRILLASGDQKIAAEFIANQLGISEIHSELLPNDKLRLLHELQKAGHKVAMVGDGINDAQALAAADLSIAMGAGRCDIAIEAADVTLARNDLMLVKETIDISQKTLKTIHQNFFASVGINAGGLVFSAVGKLSPFSAAIVHNASTIVVILNSLRLGKQVAGSNPLKILTEVKV